VSSQRPLESQVRAIAGLLRGVPLDGSTAENPAEDILRRYECGGYLFDLWTRSGRLSSLPPEWIEALRRAHRKTLVDNLTSLAVFRRIGGLLASEGIPIVPLKGAAYLLDLYRDPGVRSMTDLDFLVRRSDAGRLARRLMREGLIGEVGRHFPEDRRFEMVVPGTSHGRLEFHWFLGLPRRARVDQEDIWRRSRPAVLEGVPCRRLAVEDALLYHVIHAGDSYFGPTLKWTIDLREMLRTWSPDPGVLLERSAAWRCRSALHLSLRHLAKLFPGEAPADLLAATRPGPLRGLLQRWYLSSDPLSLLNVSGGSLSRLPMRCLLIDSPLDAVLLTVRVLARPVSRPIVRTLGGAAPPWEWSD